jgi:predicted AlkP superfamily pyrophosphatase or phosphodiesterase
MTLLLVLLLGGLAGCATQTDPANARFPGGSGGVNASEHLDKPYLVLVSLDGFRWDYPDLYTLPALQALIDDGARAERLLPVFPTLTFPNHYSIATGLYPVRHGLVSNRFPAPELGLWYALGRRETVEDGRFYAGEPIWVTAESQGMVTASFFFVGTEAEISGIRPTHWRSFTKDIPGEERVDQVLDWLALPPQHRPHLVTLYFEDVDDHSHWSGVGSQRAVDAMRRVDGYLARLKSGIEALPHGDRVNLLVVSDHGQAAYLGDQVPFDVSEHVDLDGVEVVGQGSYLFLYFSEGASGRIARAKRAINRHWVHGQAFEPHEAPSAWQLEASDRLPQLILMPDVGHMAVSELERASRLKPGAHGWAPEAEAMHGIFVAHGPNIRHGARPGPVRVVDIYPMMAELLGLAPAAGIDGDPAALQGLLIDLPGAP